MMTAAKRRKVPTLEERVTALREELDEVLDQLAEERRPRGEGKAVPAPSMRLEMDIRGGHCLCRSYLAVIKP